MTAIGFIGLGRMGGPMAANLLKAGHQVTGFDLCQDHVGALKAAGGIGAGTMPEAVKGAEIVISMLPAGEQVRAVYSGADGVIATADRSALLVDCSTIDVETARQMAALATEHGLDMLDCPVSGGIMGAKAAALTFMCGGSREGFTRAEPVLSAMGKTIVHAGGAGNGQAAKICNNMLLGISMIGVCEAFLLAESLGLDHQKLFDVSATASGQCWSLTTYCPVPGPVPSSPANRDYQPGFTAAMMLKDLQLAQRAAGAKGPGTPLGANAAQLYKLFTANGGGETDFSGIIEFLRGRPAENTP